jgi:beta-glucanase (GH16 family)
MIGCVNYPDAVASFDRMIRDRRLKSKFTTKVWLTALLIGLAIPAAHAAGAPEGWELVWSDEFNGNTLDQSKWEFEVNAQGGGNNELQYYVTNNVRVQDGSLIIEARKEHYTGPQGTREFTSSRIRTQRKGDWLYGRFDVRAKLPQGKGIWPAIWMLPTESHFGGWPQGGEIDIMELVGHKPSEVHGTLHYANTNRRHAFKGTNYLLANGAFADNFHVFRFDWEPTAMRWYIDDKLYQTQTNWTSGTNAYPAPFNQRFHLLLNLAVGGNWPGNPDATTKFPQAMAVDYVRVYRKK